MENATIEDLQARLRHVEDTLAIERVILSYGPAADAGLSSSAASLWLEDGVYDWDADSPPHDGRAAVARMLQGSGHQGLIAEGAAHFAGPPMVEIDGDRATALNYTLGMRREEGRYYLGRVSAVRWDLERHGSSWRIRRRTNRLLDESGGGLRLFRDQMQSTFAEG